MAPRADLAVFMDFEMTGNKEDDEIIEAGCSMRETQGWTEVGYYSHVVIPSTESWDRMMETNEVVRSMHQKNGLIDDIINASAVSTIENIDRDMEQWLDIYLKGDTTHIAAGGSGLSHFDRPYMKRFLPRFNKRLTFYAYDSGDHRRSFRLSGRPWILNSTNDLKTHRALDDARQHAEEWRYVLACLKNGFYPETMKQFELTFDF